MKTTIIIATLAMVLSACTPVRVGVKATKVVGKTAVGVGKAVF